MAPNRKRLRGAALVVASGILWGFSGTCGQLLSQNCGVPVEWVTFQRLFWSALFFLVVGLLFDRKNIFALLSNRKDVVHLVIYAVFGMIGCMWFYLEVIAWTNAGTGTLMEQLGLILVLACTCLMEHRGPKALEVLGLIMAFVGIFLVCTHGDPHTLVFAPQGLLWGIAACFGVAFYIMLPVPLLKNHGSLTVTAPAFVIAAAAGALIFHPWTYHVEVTGMVAFGTAGMVICGTILAYLLFMQGEKDAGPMLAGLLNTIELVAAFVISHFWLGTEISIWDIAGAACIISMMIMITLKDPAAVAKPKH
ncbi:MAG: EamA family transporter [Eggerthellaceae bacterium]|nr:EamA family transporter [Eggerthellaceae bacterium]